MTFAEVCDISHITWKQFYLPCRKMSQQPHIRGQRLQSREHDFHLCCQYCFWHFDTNKWTKPDQGSKLYAAMNKWSLCPHRDPKYSPSSLKTAMLETPIQSVIRSMTVGTPALKGREDVAEVDVALTGYCCRFRRWWRFSHQQDEWSYHPPDSSHLPETGNIQH